MACIYAPVDRVLGRRPPAIDSGPARRYDLQILREAPRTIESAKK